MKEFVQGIGPWGHDHFWGSTHDGVFMTLYFNYHPDYQPQCPKYIDIYIYISVQRFHYSGTYSGSIWDSFHLWNLMHFMDANVLKSQGELEGIVYITSKVYGTMG